jgi:hypothetical protein
LDRRRDGYGREQHDQERERESCEDRHITKSPYLLSSVAPLELEEPEPVPAGVPDEAAAEIEAEEDEG